MSAESITHEEEVTLWLHCRSWNERLAAYQVLGDVVQQSFFQINDTAGTCMQDNDAEHLKKDL